MQSGVQTCTPYLHPNMNAWKRHRGDGSLRLATKQVVCIVRRHGIQMLDYELTAANFVYSIWDRDSHQVVIRAGYRSEGDAQQGVRKRLIELRGRRSGVSAPERPKREARKVIK